jgi:hypothetical protein
MLITLTVDGWCVFCQFFFFSPRVTGAQQKQNSPPVLLARLVLQVQGTA